MRSHARWPASVLNACPFGLATDPRVVTLRGRTAGHSGRNRNRPKRSAEKLVSRVSHGSVRWGPAETVDKHRLMRSTGGVPEDPHAAGIQVLRLGDNAAFRAGN